MKKRILAVVLSICIVFAAFSGSLVTLADSQADIRSAVLSAFDAYVAENGNASTQSGLVAYINEAISETGETVTASDFYIYHAADGCYDTNTGLNAIYRVNISGHDGYVSALFDVTNGDTVGTAASIPHIEEDLGDLTTVTFDSSNEDFVLNESGQITAYTGNAEKIIIPYSAGAVTFVSNAVSTVVEGKTNNLTNVKVIVDFGTKEILPTRALQGASSLKAIIFGKYRRFYQEACLAQCPQLKCIQMPFGLNKNNNYHTISGNGTVYYRAFADSTKLSNVYLVQYSGANNAAMSVVKSFAYNLCQYASYQGNVFNNTAVMDFYYATGNVQTNLNSGGTTIGSSASVPGTRVGPAVYSSTNSTLGMAAAKVAKQLKNTVYTEGTSTADTVKTAAIDGVTYDGMTASWNDTFVGSEGVANGVLTVAAGGVDYLMTYDYNPYDGLSSLTVSHGTLTPAFDSRTYEYTLNLNANYSSIDVEATPATGASTDFVNGTKEIPIGESTVEIDTVTSSGANVTYTIAVTRFPVPTELINSIKASFNTYVQNKGNNVEPAKLISYINKQISPAFVELKEDGFYIRHAVDGCYGESEDGLEFSIPGNDGSVVATMNVYNTSGTLVYELGHLASIPHTEENLGTLTCDVFDLEEAENDDDYSFGIDANNYITSYTGEAEMIVIPAGYEGRMSMANTTNDNVKVIVVGDRTDTAMNIGFGANSVNNWANLRAVVLPKKIKNNTGIGAFAFAYNPSLKYVNLPTAINTASNGYGTFGNEAFRECSVLENARASETGKLPSCQFRTEVFRGTSIRDYLVEGYFQFGSGASMKNISNYPAYTEGTNNLLAGNGEGGSVGANFVRAVALAQEKADTYEVTNENKSSVLTAVVAAYSSKISGITAEFVGTDTIKFSYNGISINAVCNKTDNYNKAIDLVMSNAATIRTDDPSGLRFSCTVNGLAALEADATVSDVALGMIVVPSDYILTTGFSKFDLTEMNVDYLDIVKDYFVSGTTMNMVLSDILPANYNRSFSAIAYAQITYSDTHTEIVYSNSYVSAKLYDVAAADNITAITSAVNVNIPGNHLASSDFVDSASGNSDTAAKAKRAAVIGSTSGSVPASYTGTTYNIAKGTSSESIASTISGLSSGDKVLFERGGIYRICIDVPCSNLYFGAYGTGEKPYIYGSARNFAESSWTKDSGNVWYVGGVTTLNNNDAGIVVFNQGEMAGTKVNAKSHVTADGYFWYDATNKRVYLYSEVDPATRFQSIEIGVNDFIFDITGKSDITIDNLALKYTGGHAISLQSDSHDINITNCEIGFIGGSLMTHTATNTVRYGNAIELWNGGYNILVDNCWIYQIYDSGITHQGQGTVSNGTIFTQDNITVSNNLIEYCALACIEYWASDSGSGNQFNIMNNISYTNNILRFGGYGFGNICVDWDTRAGYNIYSSPACLNMLGKVENTTTPTFNISGNIIDTAKAGLVQLVNKHPSSGFPILSGNTFMQIGGRKLAVYGYTFTTQGTSYTPTTYYADSTGAAFIAGKDLTSTVTIY